MFEPGHVAYGKIPGAAAAAAIIASAGNLAAFFLAKEMLGVPFLMPTDPGSTSLAPLTPYDVVFACALPAIGAGIFLIIIDKLDKRPFPVFFCVSAFFLIFSVAFPVSLPDSVSFGTKISLEVMHMIGAVSIVGAFMKLARADEEEEESE